MTMTYLAEYDRCRYRQGDHGDVRVALHAYGKPCLVCPSCYSAWFGGTPWQHPTVRVTY